MAPLKIIGAGLGRTGTASLQLALQQLLDGRCYHMIEVFGHPEHVPLWHGAMKGDLPDWDALFDGYVAAVDWPACSFWRPLMEQYPDAPVLLSTRSSPEVWWKSADQTILEFGFRRPPPPGSEPWRAMADDMIKLHWWPVDDKEAAMAAYERHNAEVRAGVPADRLVDWQPGDGWEPLCTALGVPVPDDPFPHTNSTEEFRSRAGLDAS
jgi:hypothetical protein